MLVDAYAGLGLGLVDRVSLYAPYPATAELWRAVTAGRASEAGAR